MKLYQIHEFAKMAGVTVRTLHHYDRLGLLRPSRTHAGYRLYSLRDLERLEQIVALKFLGLPLKRIKTLLDRDPLELPGALRMQRAILQERQQLLGRAIRAIQDAEKAVQPGKPADAQLLTTIIAALKVQDRPEFMKKYLSKEAWAKWSTHQRQLSPEETRQVSQSWIDMYREAETLLGEDPAGEKAQALGQRWLDLADATAGGDTEIKTGFTKAWLDRQHWPAKNRRRIAQFKLEKIAKFIDEILASSMKKYYGQDAWARMVKRRRRSGLAARQAVWQSWTDLFRDVQSSLNEDPGGKTAQALAARWIKLARKSSGGDAGIKAGLQKAWQDRERWPEQMRAPLAAFDLDGILHFIQKAIAKRKD